MSDKGPKKLAVIDGKSVFYRGYYAMPNLATRDGISTGGVYGFATMALEVLSRLRPDYVAVAWDKPKTNIAKRLELYPEYKAGRKPAPADFYEQIPILHQLLSAFGWPLYELDDYEADDIMGSLARQASDQGIETMLITSDLDMLQLISPKVSVYALKKGLSNIELYSPTSFKAKYGLEVAQFLDLKALMGDSSDNIPGVPGIGEKTAINLLQEYQTLDNIYQNLDMIADSVAKKLISGQKLAYLSKRLAEIWVDAPVKLDLAEVDGSKVDVNQIAKLFQTLQFRSLIKQLPQSLTNQLKEAENVYQADNFNRGKCLVIDQDKALEEISLTEFKTVYIFSRSNGAHGNEPRLILISGDGVSVYALRVDKLSSNLIKTFLSNLPPIAGHNLKSTLEALINLGVTLPTIHHDTLIAGFIINSLGRDQSLTEMAQNELTYQGNSLDDLDLDELVVMAPTIIAVIDALIKHQQTEINKVTAYEWILKNIDWPIIPVLAQMEVRGIELDTNYLQRFSIQINSMLKEVEDQIYQSAGQEFNIASPSQLAEILYGKLEINTIGIKKGKNGFSTAANELEKLKDSHPIINLIMHYREVAKLKNTYVDTLPKQVDSNSRLHTTFNLTIAQTGRLSSTDPNLQNIPIRTELGRKIRSAFVASSGKSLISADYSQFELRLAAVMAKDQVLIDMFNRGADIHLMTAAEVYGRKPEDVTKQMRSAAKTINFGILYGMSPHGLSMATGMDRDQASKFINRYKEIRRPLFDYMDSLLISARDNGYVETLFGRRRPMPDILSRNFVLRTAAERAAVNMPIQGTEADIMKLAMISCDQFLTTKQDSYQLLQIHDSILVEAPADKASIISKQLQTIMQEIHKLPVRLDVDVKIGQNWGLL